MSQRVTRSQSKGAPSSKKKAAEKTSATEDAAPIAAAKSQPKRGRGRRQAAEPSSDTDSAPEEVGLTEGRLAALGKLQEEQEVRSKVGREKKAANKQRTLQQQQAASQRKKTPEELAIEATDRLPQELLEEVLEEERQEAAAEKLKAASLRQASSSKRDDHQHLHGGFDEEGFDDGDDGDDEEGGSYRGRSVLGRYAVHKGPVAVLGLDVLSSINPAAQNAAKLKSMLDQHYSEGRKRAPVRQKTDKGKPGADFLLRSLEESTALPRKPQPKKPRSR